jgi:UDP-N-acetyl-D-glucosamine dehydrogenase
MAPLRILEDKIDSKEIVVGVIGLGYVGLPLSLAFLKKNIKVIGFDLDPEKIQMIESGVSYIKHIATEEVTGYVKTGQFHVTDDFSKLSEPDALLICVPTPLSKSREPDLHYVKTTAESISKSLRKDQIVVLESTTYPGTTVEVVQPILEKSGLVAEHDFALAFSPEREDPGNPQFGTINIPKVVGGIDSISTRLGEKLYGIALEKIVSVSTTQVAEMTKLLENIFRSVNIALVNELKILCQRMGIDIWEVIEAASTKPFGYMPFYPGPGLGGHCIPIDPFYLTSKAREFDFSTKFIELAGEVNVSIPYYVVQRTMDALNEQEKSIKGSKILILGIAYKKDVDDSRESPSFKLIDLLQDKGAEILYNDPFIPKLKPVRKYNFEMQSMSLTQENLEGVDCVLVATNHSAYDYDFIYQHAKLIVDTRNVFSKDQKKSAKVVMA